MLPATCAPLGSKTEIPCPLPPSSPFPLHPYLIFISIQSGFFSPKEKKVAAEAGPASPTKLESPTWRWGAEQEG